MLDFYPNHIYYPLEEAERKYASGELRQTEIHLLNFVERHLEEIFDIACDYNTEPTDENILDALKGDILVRGTIQPAAELADVVKEISKEMWYRNEFGENKQTENEIAVDWQIKYAVKWREARLFEIFVVLEHCTNSILAKFTTIRNS